MESKDQRRDPRWAAFELQELLARREDSAAPWIPFLDASTMSAGLYVLPEGGVDHQDPHDLDELYYVVSGKATIRLGDGEDRRVGPGSVVFVQAQADHRFHSIEEELRVLVVFSSATPQRPGSGMTGPTNE